jgi:uncharacterized repeat protein (TIGR03803 family)
MTVSWGRPAVWLAGLALLLSLAFAAQAQQTADPAAAAPGFKTLYRFAGGKNGYWPRSGMILHGGALYGTTYYGGSTATDGAPGYGIIYKLTDTNGTWKLSVLHDFGVTLSDGINNSAPLNILNHTLYGASANGANPDCGCGGVFELTLPSTYTVLHHFNVTNGSDPLGGLLIDTNGTKYGTASLGGTHGNLTGGGVIYKLSSTDGFSVLHDFTNPYDAAGPSGELIFGKDGAIYGTTFGDGKYDQGEIFRITTGGSFTVLYNFLGNDQPGGSHDGADPEGRLALGPDGTIYGTTTFGGDPSDYGTAWSLTPKAGGKFTYQQIYIFGADGEATTPHSGLVRDGKGVLYGTGAGGGVPGGGVLYSLTETSPGYWKYTALHIFVPNTAGGDDPYGDLILENGVLYGTTISGGDFNGSDCADDGCGTVFQYVLP